MRRIIISLVLEAICLVCFSIAGIGYAITDPSWRLLMYGALMMAYLLMTIDNVRDLVKAIRVRKVAKAQASTDKEG